MRAVVMIPSACRILTAAMFLLAIPAITSAQQISELPVVIPKTITVFNAACEARAINSCLQSFDAYSSCDSQAKDIAGRRTKDPHNGYVAQAAWRKKYPNGCNQKHPLITERSECAIVGRLSGECVMAVPVYDPEVQTRQLNEWLKMLIDTGIIKPDTNG